MRPERPSLATGSAFGRLESCSTQNQVDARSQLPLLAKITLLTLLTPVFLSLGPLVLTPSKILFLVTVPYLGIRFLSGRYGKILIPDLLIFAYLAWMALAMFINHSPRVAVEYMGSNSLILLGGYLTARAAIRTKSDFVGFIRFLALVVAISFPFAIYESWTSRTTIPRWLDMLPGVLSHDDVQHQKRLGLWRTQWVFSHPIHYGVFCSLVFSLAFVGMKGIWSNTRRYIISGIIAVCCIFSVSSGPVLALLAQFALIGWGWALKWTGIQWRLLGWLFVIFYTIAELASNRFALYAIVEKMSFNPMTAYARKILFEYGVQQIHRTPTFGVGYHRWPLPTWLSGSIDNFWLLLAITFGVPTFIFFAAAFLSSMISIGRRDFSQDPILVQLRLGWVFTMISLILVLSTVAIWAEIYSIVLFVVGSGIWMMGASVSESSGVTIPATTRTSGIKYTRFPADSPHKFTDRT